jgi:cytochrome c oxidase subunit 4
MDGSHGAGHARHPTFRQYVMVAILLFAITIIEFALIYSRVGISDDLGKAKIPLLVVLSGIKFAIVIMFYMHLKFDSRLFTAVFLAGLALAFAVGLALLGLFVALRGEPREFAAAHATPYVEGAEGEAAGLPEHLEAAQPAPVPAAASQVKESTAKAQPETKQETVAPAQAGAASTLIISADGNNLKFNTAKFSARAGSEVTLKFNNVSTINQHNWVLVQAGAKDAVAAAGVAAGPANGWVQAGDARVIASTKLLDPGKLEEIRFTAPATGAYQFVCTFPGHNFTMFGDFQVTQ